ncbi:MAG: hypothetical protein LBT97_05420 [Planctomycetota bacterium]|nr:hypothetical protein [Planctomycetota bacterium]
MPKIPAVGDWLEYRLAFPVDPLEDSIRRDIGSGEEEAESSSAAPTPGESDGGGDGASKSSAHLFEPRFQPETRWNAMPLRLEILGAEPDAVRVMLTLPGFAHETSVPLGGMAGTGVRHSEIGMAAIRDRQERRHTVGRREYPVFMERLDDPEKGYIRLVSSELPFGFARFASPHCDLILVDMGGFPAPAFPVQDVPVAPPPGKLFPP